MTVPGKRADFIVRQAEPLNGGTALAHAVDARHRTPLDAFFVRNHGGVPEIDPATYRLRVEGELERPLELSLAALRRFPRREVEATLQCAGNRRAGLAAWRPIPGELAWGDEAIGTAVWSGWSLAELLAEAGPAATATDVELEGSDEAERHGHRFRFGGSVPLAKAADVLLADEMNGEPLPALHGAPLRAVVPGYIGARSVKWLAAVRLRPSPSENYFQRRAYRLFPAGVTAESVEWERGLMLGELPVVALVAAPDDGAEVAAGSLHVTGVAFAGERAVARVELSQDGGASWQVARLDRVPQRAVWTPWSLELDLAAGEHELVARAWDSAGQTQPPTVDQVWNFKGYLNNAWARLRLRAVAVR